MPSFKHERKDYNIQKQRVFQKSKKPSFNFRKPNEWFDNETEKQKWIKVCCKTDSPACMLDLIRELEEIVFRYGNIRKSYKPKNPMFTDGKLEFYLEITKLDSKAMCNNCHYIKRYDVKCITFDEINIPHTFPKEWTNLIEQALDRRFTKVDSTGEIIVDLSNFINDPFLTGHGLLLNMSIPNVMKQVFKLFKDTGLKSITTLNLRNNELKNIFQLEQFCQHCTVFRVDLSDNRLNRLSDLKFMAKNSIIDLNVLNNEFEAQRKKKPKELQDQIRKMLPRLAILNDRTLPASVVIAGEIPTVAKSLPDSVFADKNIDVYRDFVVRYCAAFDNSSRDGIWEFYSSESVLSVSCYTSDMPHCYRHINANIRTMRGHESISTLCKRGKSAIMGTFVSFMKTKHMEESLNVDIVFRSTNDIMFVLTGTFIECPEKGGKTYRPRQFSRTFVINGGIILQDHLCLMPTDANLSQTFKATIVKLKEKTEFAEKYKSELSTLTTEAIDIVQQFKEFTGMTVKACLDFLSMVNNPSEALTKFTEMKEHGAISMEAFDNHE